MWSWEVLIAWESEINTMEKNGTTGMRKWMCRKWWYKNDPVKLKDEEYVVHGMAGTKVYPYSVGNKQRSSKGHWR